ncbi:MAG: hypothetical protein WCV99_03955 [Sterolibacterium sp.]|jgi:hypothetical protein
MRVGRNLGVSGGIGILFIHGFFWVLYVAVATIIRITLLVTCAIGVGIQASIKKRELNNKHLEHVALAQRIVSQRVEQIEYLPAGHTNPPALWGVYLIEPSCGSSYSKYGPHPSTLRKLWLENRRGTVHEVIVLHDKPMAAAAVDFLRSGIFKLNPGAKSVVSGFAPNGKPTLCCVRPSIYSSNQAA